MTDAIVFVGPSLSAADSEAWPQIEFRPPVSQGTCYAAAREGPRAIGIVDGYFDGVAAVCHKEILWALSNGIAVFGASSMGALRAAELHAFGMVGVGRIFEDYRDGRLTGDDEVALLHGPAETGYLPLSEPMVNIRATVAQAVADDVIGDPAAAALIKAAKALFYQDRQWSPAIAAAEAEGHRLERFAAWLPQNRIDRKREDAFELIRAVEAFLASGARAELPCFTFEATEAFLNAPWFAGGGLGSSISEAVLDELRLQKGAYERFRREALLGQLSEAALERTGTRPERAHLARAAAAFRLPRGLCSQSDLAAWAASNDTDARSVDRMIAAEAAVAACAAGRDTELHDRILDRARVAGSYAGLRDRAARKIARSVRGNPGRSAPSPPELLAWYFEHRLKSPIPDDIAGYARSLGLAAVGRFYDLLAKEHGFLAGRDDMG